MATAITDHWKSCCSGSFVACCHTLIHTLSWYSRTRFPRAKTKTKCPHVRGGGTSGQKGVGYPVGHIKSDVSEAASSSAPVTRSTKLGLAMRKNIGRSSTRTQGRTHITGAYVEPTSDSTGATCLQEGETLGVDGLWRIGPPRLLKTGAGVCFHGVSRYSTRLGFCCPAGQNSCNPSSQLTE